MKPKNVVKGKLFVGKGSSSDFSVIGVKDPMKLFGCIVLCNVAAVVGMLFTFSAIPTWYAHLAKPWFTPPSWLFGPVWILLYMLMGYALCLVWEAKPKTGIAYKLFGLQLVLNAMWSIIFFGLKNPFAAFIEILALWATIALTACVFERISKKAAWLMIPYLLWVGFAAVLTFAVFVLNP